MKELSIEQKAKSYDEAIERAREYKKHGYMTINVALDNIFPELKESEDERIRKEIISALKFANHKGVYDKHLAWLEKQGEQNLPIEKLPFEMKTVSESLGLTTQNECDDYNKMVTDLIMSDDDNGEQKPVWSEEDEKVIHCLEYTVRHFYEDEDTIKWCCDWLKSIKDRVQPKQEWSKEDDEHLKRILKELESQYQKLINRPYLSKIESDYNWLKSLRPQNRWKPSDEQMIAIQEAMNIVGILTITGSKINSLYQDLKKLK